MSDTPIYDTLVVERDGRWARDYVRSALGPWVRVCPVCDATVGTTCRTRSGVPTRDHKGRREQR